MSMLRSYFGFQPNRDWLCCMRDGDKQEVETAVMVVAINSENDKRWEGSRGIYSLIGLILHWNFDQQLTCVGGRDWSAQLVATIHDQTKFESASWIYNSNQK